MIGIAVLFLGLVSLSFAFQNNYNDKTTKEFIHWGQKTCPISSTLIYTGVGGGRASGYSNNNANTEPANAWGGGGNYLCMNVAGATFPSGSGPFSSPSNQYRIFPMKYFFSQAHGLQSLSGKEVPCAVCRANNNVPVIMQPGSTVCPSTWTNHFSGYLMSPDGPRSTNMGQFICLSSSAIANSNTPYTNIPTEVFFSEIMPAEYCTNGGSPNICGDGTLSSPYVNGMEVSCAVCSPPSASAGPIFTNWGKNNNCPAGNSIVYNGRAVSRRSGNQEDSGGLDILCATLNVVNPPVFLPEINFNTGLVVGVQYFTKNGSPDTWNVTSLLANAHLYEVPCTVCMSTRALKESPTFMLPGSRTCPSGFTAEYDGYVMSNKDGGNRNEHICVNKDADTVGSALNNVDSSYLMPNEIKNTGLPSGFISNREVACVQCTALASKGTLYYRWGSQTCPSDQTTVYSGVISESQAGAAWASGTQWQTTAGRGGGYNKLCLHQTPEWPVWRSDLDGTAAGSFLSSSQFYIRSPINVSPSAYVSYHSYTTFCSLCSTGDSPFAVLQAYTNWGSTTCPSALGWKTSYTGFMMGSHVIMRPSQVICMDIAPQKGANPAENTLLMGHMTTAAWMWQFGTTMVGGASGDTSIYQAACAVCVMVDNNDCALNPCGSYGICNDIGLNSFNCTCLTGWNGALCNTDINECAVSNGGCDPLTSCTNTLGSYTCGSCPAGLSGNGVIGCVLNTPNVTAPISPGGGRPGVTIINFEGVDFGTDESRLIVSIRNFTCRIVGGSLNTLQTRFSCLINASTPIGKFYPWIRRTSSVVSMESSATSFYPVEILPVPVVIRVNSSVGPAAGGSTITLFGSNFSLTTTVIDEANMAVTIGGANCPIIGSSLDVSTSGFPNELQMIKCVTQPSVPGTFNVLLSHYGITSAILPTFAFIESGNPSIYSVTPSGVQKGYVLTVVGSSFGSNPSDITAFLGPFPCVYKPNTLSPDGSIFLCTLGGTPPTLPTGIYTFYAQILSINMSNPSATPNGIPIAIVPSPIIQSLTPAGGKAGSLLNFTGLNFLPFPAANPTVTVGNQPCPSISVSATEILCYAPALASGTYSIQVNTYRDVVPTPASTLVYESVDQPVLASLSPVGGATGTILTMSGIVGLNPAVVKVYLSNSSSSFLCQNLGLFTLSLIAQQITCNIPTILNPGSYSISLSRYLLVAVGPSLTFIVVSAPSITQISPRGGLAGQTTILVEGARFGNIESALQVNFGTFDGGEPLPVPCNLVPGSLNIAGTSFQCNVGYGFSSFGDKDISASVFLTRSTVSSGVYFRVAPLPPAINSVTPAGGIDYTNVTITGSNFGTDKSVVTVSLGSFDCIVLNLTQVTPSLQTLICSAFANGLTGQVAVTVSLFGTLSSSSATSGGQLASFTFINPPAILYIDPPTGHAGLSLTVSGYNFGSIPTDCQIRLRQISFSGNSTSCLILSSSFSSQGTFFVCTTLPNDPILVANRSFDVIVSRFDISAAVPSRFDVIAYPHLSSVTPQGSLTEGGTLITLYGQGFGTDGDQLSITVGTSPCVVYTIVTPVSDTQVSCVVPAGIRGVAQINLTRFATPSSNSLPFVYFESPVVTNINPAGGVTGTAVTVTGINFGTDASQLNFTIGVNGDLNCIYRQGSLVNGTSFICVIGNVASSIASGPSPYQIHLYGRAFQMNSQSLFHVINPAPTISDISPSSGLIGSLVTIQGTSFSSSEVSLFVSVKNVGASVNSSCIVVPGSLNSLRTSFSCQMPALGSLDGAGPSEVVVSVFTIPSTNFLSFSFSSSSSSVFPIVFSVSPPGGIGTGSIITIAGAQFSLSSLSVCLGSPQCYPCVILSRTISSIICNTTVPTAAYAFGTYLPVVVTSSTLEDIGTHQPFIHEVVFPPAVVSISPRAGGVAGSLITLFGRGFAPNFSSGDMKVLFGQFSSTISDYRYISTSGLQYIVCEAPINTIGPVSLIISSMGTTALAPFPIYVYPTSAVISSVAPIGGGFMTNVTIMASGLQVTPSTDISTSGLEVVFKYGIYNATAVITEIGYGPRVTTIKVVAPDLQVLSSVSMFEARVELYSFALPSLSNGLFIYALAPIITKITPESAFKPLDLLTLIGSNFGDGVDYTTISITLGEAPCQISLSSYNSTYVVCTSPSNVAAGTTSIQMISFGSFQAVFMLNGATTPSDYSSLTSIVDPPLISKISPHLITFGSDVTITGSNFFLSRHTEGRSSLIDVSDTELSRLSVTILPLIDVGCNIIDGFVDEAGAETAVCQISPPSLASSPVSQENVKLSVSLLDVAGQESTESVTLYVDVLYVKTDSPIGILITVLHTSMAFVVLITIPLYHRNSALPYIKSQSPIFCYLIMGGMIVILMTFVPFLGIPNEISCNARVFIPFLGLFIMFVPLLLKVHRINVIFGNKEMKMIILRDIHLLTRFAAALTCFIILLIITVTIATTSPVIILPSNGGQVYFSCRSDNPNQFETMITVLIVIVTIMMIYGVYLSFSTRNVTSNYNESKQLGLAIYNWAAIAVLVAPVAYAQNDNPSIMFLLGGMGVFVGCLFSWSVLFGQRLFNIIMNRYQGDEEALRSSSHSTAFVSGHSSVHQKSTNMEKEVSMTSF